MVHADDIRTTAGEQHRSRKRQYRRQSSVVDVQLGVRHVTDRFSFVLYGPKCATHAGEYIRITCILYELFPETNSKIYGIASQ